MALMGTEFWSASWDVVLLPGDEVTSDEEVTGGQVVVIVTGSMVVAVLTVEEGVVVEAEWRGDEHKSPLHL